MTVRLIDDSMIALDGACPIEDAEHLLQLLLGCPQAMVDWRGCDSVHTAVIQVIMASGAKIVGPPRGVFLAEFASALVAHSKSQAF